MLKQGKLARFIFSKVKSLGL